MYKDGGIMNNITNWLLAIIIVLLLGGGVYWVYSNQNASKNTGTTTNTTNNANTDTANTDTTKNLANLSEAVTAKDHKLGPDNAPVVLVEYSDFQCPACKQLSPVFKSMVDKFPGKVQFVYRHFPLLEIHPLANDAAKISEAAAKQGKFFEMADFYFQNSSFTLDSAYAYAATLGLNVDSMKSEVANGDYDAIVSADIASGTASGVAGTPTMFMNGKQLPWEQTTDIENVIKKQLGQ